MHPGAVHHDFREINPVDVADNLRARRLITQARVLTRSAHAIVVVLGLAFVLLTLPGARQIGASLLASAGVAGLVAGIAARPVLGNFIAGLQIAFSQPIRIDDVLIVNGEWARSRRSRARSECHLPFDALYHLLHRQQVSIHIERG